ncbi:MAG: response regulator [Thermoanaerobaculia bacterium]
MVDLGELSILVVDDEPDYRFLTGEMLTELGVGAVSLVESPDAALKVLAEKPVDILLSDLKLNLESGLRLIEDARATSPGTRAILMSAYASARDAEDATAAGAVSVLNKPFTPSSLELALRRAAAASTGLWGQVHDLSLIDLLQMYHYGKRSVVLHLSGPPSGTIQVANGEIVHAAMANLEGEPALRALLQATAGAVRTEVVSPEASRVTISRDFGTLLLDALRQIDEDTHEENTGEANMAVLFEDEDDSAADLAQALDRGDGTRGTAFNLPITSLESEPTSTGTDSSLVATRKAGNGPAVHLRPKTYQPHQGEIKMVTERELEDTLGKIKSDVAGFIGASVVDLDSGMTLAVLSTRSDFDLAAASAYNSEMVKQKLKIMKALNLQTTLEDMLITLGDQLHLIKMITSSTFIYLAADRASTNLAIVRAAANKHLGGLQ